MAKMTEKLAATTDPADKTKLETDIGKLDKDIKKAEGDLKKFENDKTSMVGLDKPFFLLKNPGLLSIPLGFLCVIFGSLLFRDTRSEAMWDELYVRQHTGLHAEGALAH
jgi:cation/acetate symporter